MAIVHILLAAAAVATSPPTAQSAASEFLDAFRAMDQQRFDRFFAPDATMFFPDGPFPEARVDGREAILATFHRFFGLMKDRGAEELTIKPAGLTVQELGDLALISFKLDGDESVGRRSILFRKTSGGWQIVHFHASTRDKPAQPPADTAATK